MHELQTFRCLSKGGQERRRKRVAAMLRHRQEGDVGFVYVCGRKTNRGGDEWKNEPAASLFGFINSNISVT